MANTIVWADIPVTDMDRARKFYAGVLEAEIPLMDGANGDVALLPGEMGTVSADLARGENQKPGPGGCTVYLGSNGDPEGMIERAVAAGGALLVPVTDMGSRTPRATASASTSRRKGDEVRRGGPQARPASPGSARRASCARLRPLGSGRIGA